MQNEAQMEQLRAAIEHAEAMMKHYEDLRGTSNFNLFVAYVMQLNYSRINRAKAILQGVDLESFEAINELIEELNGIQ